MAIQRNGSSSSNLAPMIAPTASDPNVTVYKTGTDVEAGTTTLFDPTTGEYKVVAHDPTDPFKYNPRGDLTSWAMVNGVRTLVDTSDPSWKDSMQEVTGDASHFDNEYTGPISSTAPQSQPVSSQPASGAYNFDPSRFTGRQLSGGGAPAPAPAPTGGGGGQPASSPGWEALMAAINGGAAGSAAPFQPVAKTDWSGGGQVNQAELLPGTTATFAPMVRPASNAGMGFGGDADPYQWLDAVKQRYPQPEQVFRQPGVQQPMNTPSGFSMNTGPGSGPVQATAMSNAEMNRARRKGALSQ